MNPRIRIAVDIGGTFTDLEFVDEATGRSAAFKTPTTAEDPSLGLANALTGAAQTYGFTLDDITLVLHGTTIATNAVLTRNLPAGSLITTAGFEDVLEIGRHARRDVYSLRAEERHVLIPRRHRFVVAERISASGKIVSPLNRDEVRAVGVRILEAGHRVVAVALLNAYTNPEHEVAVGRVLRELDPGLCISLSHEVSPEIREYERTATTTLNALLMPVVQNYVKSLESRRGAIGLKAPIYLVQSNGGAATLEQAGLAPAKLLLSGPSGGVLASERTAQELGLDNVVAVDMGGTSYDISILQHGRRSVITQGEVDGIPVRLPMVDMRTIGAGGGSIAHLDRSGRLKVGPQSAAAVPGPVCYGRGGVEPTVTDANLVLGRLDPDSFLGGALKLDAEGARAAVQNRIAAPLGLHTDEAAAGVIAVTVARLASAIKLSLFERGLDPRDFQLMSFGGAGGAHAIEVAAELGMGKVVFPRDPSTFSALGILMSDIIHDMASSGITPLTPEAGPALAERAAALKAAGDRRLAADGLAEGSRDFIFTADLRYRGQAFDLMIGIEDPSFPPAEIARLEECFHAEHCQRFSFDDRGERIEIVTLRAAAIGRLGQVAHGLQATSGEPAPVGQRRLYEAGAWRSVPVYALASIGSGSSVWGPAVIDHEYTTILVPDGWSAIADSYGHLVATAAGKRK